MYPFGRFLLTLWRGKRAAPVVPGETSVVRTRCWPWDCDMFFEMNNGRHLTLYDLGRFDYGQRTGLMDLLRRKKWGLAVGGASVRYRRRILPFQRVDIKTTLAARDERWFYFIQTMEVKGQACSSALVRTAVLAKGKAHPTQDVADDMGFPDWNPEPPEWIRAWIRAEDLRPWPPVQ